jgi:hypothetical protein
MPGRNMVEMSGLLCALAALSPEGERASENPLYRGLGGPHNWLGQYSEVQILNLTGTWTTMALV